MGLAIIVLVMLLGPVTADAQYTTPPGAGVNREQGGPGGAGPGPGAIQHGAQPNPADGRPGSRDGDSPSAVPGTLVRDPVERRILGLPVNAVLVIGGVLLVLLVVAGLVIPRARRRERARGGGTYGRP